MMPQNKKKDNYSTAEQVIGTWIDGKPLYRKVLVCENYANSNSNRYEFNNLIPNIKHIINVFLFTYNYHKTGNETQYVKQNNLWSNNQKVIIVTWELNATDYPYSDVYVIVEYTKTTD